MSKLLQSKASTCRWPTTPSTPDARKHQGRSAIQAHAHHTVMPCMQLTIDLTFRRGGNQREGQVRWGASMRLVHSCQHGRVEPNGRGL